MHLVIDHFSHLRWCLMTLSLSGSIGQRRNELPIQVMVHVS